MLRLFAIALTALLTAAPSVASAQSTPNFSYGQVPTAGQYNAAFAAKQDLLNFTPLNINGGTMRGKLNTSAATVNGAGFALLPGASPTAPSNGDLWVTSAGIYAQVNGSTLSLGGSGNLGTMSTQNANAVNITGGTINGTVIGGTTPAPGSFSTLVTATPLPVTSGGLGATSLTSAIDTAFGSTQGSILYRGPAQWTTLTPGTAGYLLQTGGTGANPSWVAPPTTSAAQPVRQTVVSGPTSSGAPSFLPSTTSGTLTHTTTGVSSTTPLVPTAAQGINTATGAPLNYTAAITANLSWTLTASATNFEFVNAQTGATYVSTLAPIYQNGGTISVTAGQFTFDYSPTGMIGYLGNGTTAVPTPLVAVGEAVTSSTAVTSATAYAYQGFYDSGWTNTYPAISTQTVRQHNVGATPLRKMVVAEFITASNGYAVGEQIDSTSGLFTSTTLYGETPPLPSTRNGITLVTGNSSALVAIDRSTFNSVGIPVANVKWKIVVRRDFGGS